MGNVIQLPDWWQSLNAGLSKLVASAVGDLIAFMVFTALVAGTIWMVRFWIRLYKEHTN